MIHPDTYLKSTAKGLELFAKRRFEHGTVLWITDDVDAKIPLSDYFLLDARAPRCRGTISQVDPYRADLRIRLADILPTLLSVEQPLLDVKSSENDAFFDLLYACTGAQTGPQRQSSPY